MVSVAIDWLEWAQANNVPVKLQAFLRFRPSLLSDFDAKRSRNPTPRSWASVALIPESIEKKAKLFREHVAGSVGDGAAAEYVGFLRVMKRLPSAERIINDPEGIEIPSANDIQWATIAQLSSVLTTHNAEAIWTYTARLNPEMTVAAAKMYLSANRKDFTSAKTRDGNNLYSTVVARFLLKSGLLI